MKKMFKISLGILFVGLVLIIIGFVGHGNRNVTYGYSNGSTLFSMHPSVEHKVNKKLISNQKFNNINVNATRANVIIRTGKQYSVSYKGSSNYVPRVTISNQTLCIKQSGYSSGIFFNYSDGNGTIIITVPKDCTLSGKLGVVEGDLRISEVDLTNMDINASDGDINYNSLKINGGKTTLGDGDFTSRHVTYQGTYTVKNTDGDNKVINSKTDGIVLQTVDGSNKIDGVDHGSQKMAQNENAANVLNLQNTDGDNSVINITAVQ